MVRPPAAKPAPIVRKKILKHMYWLPVALIVLYLIDMQTQGRVTPDELAGWLAEGKQVTVIDVRSQAEFDAAHVPGALHVPFLTAISRASELKQRERPFVVYCEHGPRASLARAGLRLAGVGDVLSISGHYGAWRAADLPNE